MPSQALPVILRLCQDFFCRPGPRATLLEYLPVAGLSEAESLRLPTDELVNRWVFEFAVRSVARELLNASEHEQEVLARTLDPADCPGSWLRWKLRLCVRWGSSEPNPSHHFDAERLAYLPYVDLLLTDKQMVEFVREIMRDESTPQRIRRLRPPLSLPFSVDALEEAIDSLGPGASQTANGPSR